MDGLSLGVPGIFVEGLFWWFWSQVFDIHVMADAQQGLPLFFLALLQTRSLVLYPISKIRGYVFMIRTKCCRLNSVPRVGNKANTLIAQQH